MSTTTHQGAEGAETMTAGPGDILYRSEWETTRTITHEEAHEIARRLIASHFNRADCETARASIPANPDRDDDLLINSYIKQQARKEAATPAPRTDGGMKAGEDGAWPFERTRTYLLAELERLRADLHTIGEDLTGEQGKTASWLDVATGRVANVSSVLASATPAQPAGAVPDGLRVPEELAEAAMKLAQLASYSEITGDIQGSNRPFIRKACDEIFEIHRAYEQRFYETVTTAVRTASHPAGQSAGSGADGWLPIETAPKDGTRVDLWVVPYDAFANGNADRLEARWMERVGWVRIGGGYVSECGEPTHWRPRPGAPGKPAPDRTRTGAAETEDAVASAIEGRWTDLVGPAYEGGWVGWKRRDLCREFAKAALAARPEAPSDAGWRETFETIAQWCEETFGPITPERIVSRAGEEMDELRAEPTRVEEAADVLICLARYPGLWAAVERKMKVNRGRKWRLMGDGTGYHIKPTPPSDPAPSGQAEG